MGSFWRNQRICPTLMYQMTIQVPMLATDQVVDARAHLLVAIVVVAHAPAHDPESDEISGVQGLVDEQTASVLKNGNVTPRLRTCRGVVRTSRSEIVLLLHHCQAITVLMFKSSLMYSMNEIEMVWMVT